MAYGDADVFRADGSKLQKGDRVLSGDDFGTVLYIGCVPPSDGIWLGVNWDNPDRGKHDGSHRDIRYFNTSTSTSGSFVRESKVDTGQDCLSALNERYQNQYVAGTGVAPDQLCVFGAINHATVPEFIGAWKMEKILREIHRRLCGITLSYHGATWFLKLRGEACKKAKTSIMPNNITLLTVGCPPRHLELRRRVILNNLRVYGSKDEVSSLWKVVPEVEELDLSSNLFASWDIVAKLCDHLPRMTVLNVSANRLQDPTDSFNHAPSFNKIRTLFMNTMAVSWNQVLAYCSMFSCLEHLRLFQNNISTMFEPLDCLINLVSLDLASNNISSFEEILKLGTLPKLQSLVLIDNAIDRIYLPDVAFEQTSKFFTSLQELSISGVHLKGRSSFDELNKLSNLTSLRVDTTPCFCDVKSMREFVVAKVARLKAYNRTEILRSDRRTAELYYLQLFGPDWLKSSSDDPSHSAMSVFLSHHPRFPALLDKHGAPILPDVGSQGTLLKDSLISVKLAMPEGESEQVFEKRIPVTMSVQRLRTLVQRLFHLQSDFKLSYVSHKSDCHEVEFDNDLRQLSFYSVEPGDTILVKLLFHA